MDVGKWENFAAGGSVLNITYTQNGSQRTQSIPMPTIERNDWLDFYFTVKPNVGIEIEYIVADWDEDLGADGNPTYEIEYNYPQYTNPIQPENGATLEGNAQYPQPTVWYSPNSDEGSCTFKFQITGPTNQEWVPTLEGKLGTAENFQVRVYMWKLQRMELYMMIGVCQREQNWILF